MRNRNFFLTAGRAAMVSAFLFSTAAVAQNNAQALCTMSQSG